MFIIELVYTASLYKIDASMAAHVAFLKKHYASGHFLISGRTALVRPSVRPDGGGNVGAARRRGAKAADGRPSGRAVALVPAEKLPCHGRSPAHA